MDSVLIFVMGAVVGMAAGVVIAGLAAANKREGA